MRYPTKYRSQICLGPVSVEYTLQMVEASLDVMTQPPDGYFLEPIMSLHT